MDERLDVASRRIAQLAPDARLVAATPISDTDSILLKLSASDVGRAVQALRSHCPLWSVSSVESEVFGRPLLNILLPSAAEQREIALARAGQLAPALCLRLAAVALAAAVLVVPLLQLAQALLVERSAHAADSASDG
jgi:hypothetical protein